MRFRSVLAVVVAGAAISAEKKVRLEDLPPAVQAAVREQTRNATLLGLTTETEKGKTTYEVETRVNGKGRDLVLDRNGAIEETEEEVELDTLPSAAKTAIQKRAAGGTIAKVEKATAGSSVSYEATIKTKAGKNIEYGVNADGTPHKED